MDKAISVLDVPRYIFCNTSNMLNTLGDDRHSHRQLLHRMHSFRKLDVSYLLHSILETIRQDFKNAPVGLKLTDILGLPATLFSVLDIVLDNSAFNAMPTPFKWTIFAFSCLYLVTLALRGYEKYRADKLENDKNYFNWEREKQKILNGEEKIK